MLLRALLPVLVLTLAPALAACGGSEEPADSTKVASPVERPLGVAGRDGAGVRAQLVLDFRDRLESSPEFHLLALKPEEEEDRELPADPKDGEGGEFHGYRILGRTVIKDATERRALVEALYAGINSSKAEEMLCFRPRHGIHLADARQGQTDFVICFECGQVHIYGGYAHEEMVAYAVIDPVAESAFDAALKRHGLEKAGR